MIDKAWRAVTPLTIHSCLKKSGFPSPNLVEMDNALTEFNAEPSLWEALPEQDLTFDDYVLVDTDIAVWGALSDAEVVALDHNNTESDEDESEELTPVSLSEAKVSLNKLRNLFLQNHVDADILQASFVLEKSIEKKVGALGHKTVGRWGIVGFSDIGSAAEVKRKGDDKVMETEESIPISCIDYGIRMLRLVISPIPFSILLSMGKLIHMISSHVLLGAPVIFENGSNFTSQPSSEGGRMRRVSLSHFSLEHKSP
ncbi:tigger transposable element-derived protein 6 [Trichonephila clavipes]|nr:tigger transposable element-derived protein 6 [Trichonephila clavipes]